MKTSELKARVKERGEKQKFFQVLWESRTGSSVGGWDSPIFESRAQAEEWVSYELPYRVQKCRDGSYEIVEVDKEGNEL